MKSSHRLASLSVLCLTALAGCSAPSAGSEDKSATTSSALTNFASVGSLMPFGGSTNGCLQVKGNGLTVGPCNSSAAQSITLVPASGNFVNLRTSTGLCAEVQGGKLETRTPTGQLTAGVIDLVPCNTSSLNQEWLVAGGQILAASMNDPTSGTNNAYCLDIYGGNTAVDGSATVDDWICNGTGAQEFWTAGYSMGIESTYVAYVTGGQGSGECLTSATSSWAPDEHLYDDVCANNSQDLEWFVLTEQHQISPNDMQGWLCLTSTGGLGLQLEFCNSQPDQQWFLQNKSYTSKCGGTGSECHFSGASTFVNGAGGCLDVQYGSATPGTIVDVAGCTPNNQAQLWSSFLGNNQPVLVPVPR